MPHAITTIHKSPRPTPPLPSGTPDRTLDWLRHCPLFSHIGATALAVVAAQTTSRNLAPGEILFESGTPADGFYIVVFGSMALVLPGPHGEEKLVELVGAGESFGQAAMFLEIPFPVVSRSLSETLLLHVPSGPVFDLLRQDPALARKMLAGMALRMHRLIHDIEGYAFRSAAGRLADYLLTAAREGDGGVIRIPVTKGALASKLLVAPATLSRVLKEWSGRGWITVQGRQITLLDRPALQSEAQARAG